MASMLSFSAAFPRAGIEQGECSVKQFFTLRTLMIEPSRRSFGLPTSTLSRQESDAILHSFSYNGILFDELPKPSQNVLLDSNSRIEFASFDGAVPSEIKKREFMGYRRNGVFFELTSNVAPNVLLPPRGVVLGKTVLCGRINLSGAEVILDGRVLRFPCHASL